MLREAAAGVALGIGLYLNCIIPAQAPLAPRVMRPRMQIVCVAGDKDVERQRVCRGQRVSERTKLKG